MVCGNRQHPNHNPYIILKFISHNPVNDKLGTLSLSLRREKRNRMIYGVPAYRPSMERSTAASGYAVTDHELEQVENAYF